MIKYSRSVPLNVYERLFCKGEIILTKSAKTSLISLIFILLQVFAGGILSFLPLEKMGSNQMTIVFYIMIYLVPLAAILLVSRDNIKDTLSVRNPGIKNIVFSLIITVCLMPFITLLSYISMIFFPNIVSEELIFLAQNESLALTIVALAVFPAICEELIFRGKLFSGYKKGIGVTKAIFISGLIFGLAHFNMQQFLYAFVIGMVFALMVSATGSIFVSIVPHFVINGSQILLSYFLYGENGYALDYISNGMENKAVFDLQYFTYILIFSIVFLIPAILLLKKMISMNSKKEDETLYENESEKDLVKEKMFTAPLYIIIVIYVLYTVSGLV